MLSVMIATHYFFISVLILQLEITWSGVCPPSTSICLLCLAVLRLRVTMLGCTTSTTLLNFPRISSSIQKELVHGVIRKGRWCFTSVFNPEEVNTRIAQDQIRGTSKTAVLEGYLNCPIFLVTSVYDTKTCSLHINVSWKISWLENIKKYF